MTKNQTLRRVFSGGVFISLLYAANAFALTGTCSMLTTGPVPYGAVTSTDELALNNTLAPTTLIDKAGLLMPGFATPFAAGVGAVGPYIHLTRREVPNGFVSDYNTLAVVDFTASKISINITFVTYGFARPTVWGQALYTGIPFTTATGPIPGSLAVTAALPATLVTPNAGGPAVLFPAQSMNAIAVPVNGGKTLLVQGAGNPFSGVCQF